MSDNKAYDALVDLMEQLRKGGFVSKHGLATELFAVEAANAAIAEGPDIKVWRARVRRLRSELSEARRVRDDLAIKLATAFGHLAVVAGDLAEHAAADLDHGGYNHSHWYRAVKRARQLLKANVRPESVTPEVKR